MSERDETIEVRKAHRFDVESLEQYLKDRIAGFGDDLQVRQFAGGQSNPTYLLETSSGRYVLRRKPPGKLLPSAHAVDREYRVLRALADTEVPVARAHVLCEDDSVIGTAFYVMDFVEGRVLRDPLLPGHDPEDRRAIYEEMARVLARLHAVDVEAVGLGDFGKKGSYLERQIHRWSKQYRLSETQEIPEMDRLIEWLPANVPPGDETALVHGDYRLENSIFDATEPRMLAVLDWELSTLGHPLADLAYNCMPYRLSPDSFTGFGQADFAALGIPDEREYVEIYCRESGRDEIEHWDYYLAFSIFRIAAILQGIAKRAIDGTASSRQAHERGAMAPAVAREAWSIAQAAS